MGKQSTSPSKNDLTQLHVQAFTLHEAGKLKEAEALYQRILAANPKHADVLRLLGTLYFQQGNHEKAIHLLGRSLEINPRQAEAYNNRGVAFRELKRYDEALESYDKAIELKPDYAEAYANRGFILQEKKRYGEALADHDKAIALKPNHLVSYYNRAVILQEIKYYVDALKSYEKAIALKPDYAEAYNNRGVIYHELKLYDEALISYHKALELKPDYAEIYHNLGGTLISKGDMEAAEAMFYKALALKPDLPRTLWGLTGIRKYKDADHDDVKRLQKLLEKPDTVDKEYLYFALGKIYDDCGRYDDAFENYHQANEVCNASTYYNPDDVSQLTRNIIDVFSKEFVAQSFAFASDKPSPLFIVGMPRSGTTLVASITSNHPYVASAGELKTITECIAHMHKMIGNNVHFPQATKDMTPDIASALTKGYEKRLRRDIKTDVSYIIDKNPLNFRHLGFIAKLFPHARVIHCTRHPLDVGLSNYFQRFSPDYAFAFDLRNIGHFYGEYLKIMEHWKNVLPLKMMDISYEKLIGNREEMTRKILAFLELEWDERCMSPHKNTSGIETASRWQVRQPVYTQSVERWRHYEKHLGPLKEALGTK